MKKYFKTLIGTGHESCQFTKNVGQYYGWHCDSWDKPYSRLLKKQDQSTTW